MGWTLITPRLQKSWNLESGDIGGANRPGTDGCDEKHKAARLTPRLRPATAGSRRPESAYRGVRSPYESGPATSAALTGDPGALRRGRFPARDPTGPTGPAIASAFAEANPGLSREPRAGSGPRRPARPGPDFIPRSIGGVPASRSAPGGGLASPRGTAPGLSEGVSLTHRPWVPSSRLAGPAAGH